MGSDQTEQVEQQADHSQLTDAKELLQTILGSSARELIARRNTEQTLATHGEEYEAALDQLIEQASEPGGLPAGAARAVETAVALLPDDPFDTTAGLLAGLLLERLMVVRAAMTDMADRLTAPKSLGDLDKVASEISLELRAQAKAAGRA